jgi:uncharacterized protein
MSAHISGLFRYPIKGLSREPLPSVTLQPGRGVPGDRAFALALPGNPFDEANPVALRKTEFLMLARQEALARLQTTYDPLTGQLSVRDGAAFNSHDLCTPEGRRASMRSLRSSCRRTRNQNCLGSSPHLGTTSLMSASIRPN